MKAILVIDMPNGCDECPLNSHTEYDFDVCWVTQGKGGCPLKDLPSHKEIKGNWKNEVDVWIDGANYGYNNCLDEILGETE